MRFAKIKGPYPFCTIYIFIRTKNILPSTESSGDLLPRTMPVNNTRKQSFARIDILKKNSMKIKTTTLLEKRESNFNRLTAIMF